MAELRHSGGGPALHDFGKGFVFGDFPTYLDGFGRHASAGFQWFGSEPRPDYDTVGFRVAGSNTEGKWIAAEFG
jgi:hypothetical protein